MVYGRGRCNGRVKIKDENGVDMANRYAGTDSDELKSSISSARIGNSRCPALAASQKNETDDKKEMRATDK